MRRFDAPHPHAHPQALPGSLASAWPTATGTSSLAPSPSPASACSIGQRPAAQCSVQGPIFPVASCIIFL
eukprot:scaffold191136_cov37-Tisochrysis_lutea.AAC.1